MRKYMIRIGLWSCINGMLFITRQDFQSYIDLGRSVLSLDLGLYSLSIGALLIALAVPITFPGEDEQ